MKTVCEAFDSLVAVVAESGLVVEPNPGASEADIAEVEQVMGFELVPELRDLYRHADGATGDDLIGSAHEFNSLREGDVRDAVRLEFLKLVHTKDEIQEHYYPGLRSVSGAPSQPFLVFSGFFGFAVECGPVATGGVMFQSEEGGFQWVARSLTDFFELLEGKYLAGPPGSDPYWNVHSVVGPMGIQGEEDVNWRWD